MGIVEAKNLTFEYIRRDEEGNVEGITTAVDNVNIDIKAGDFVAVLGHNGSGKSTLARHLNVLLQPTEGTVWINGHDTKEQREWLEIRKTAGMVFQNPDNQIIASVVEEDVAFGPENMGVPTEEIWQRVAKSLESVDMTAYRYHSPNKLSGGQKQRGFFQSRGASEIGAGCSPDHGVSLAAETAGNDFFRRYSDPGTVYS